MKNNTKSISIFKKYLLCCVRPIFQDIEGKPVSVRIGLNQLLFTSLESGY